MIERRLADELEALLGTSPAVVLTGPRQVGKTTLALELAERRPSVYLDLESPTDRARIANAELYLEDHADELVVLDEVQRVPELFEILRGVIDRGRRAGRRRGRFLLLGSASLDLLSRSGESLAGRVALVELGPLTCEEVEVGDQDRLWRRGGLPESFLAPDDRASLRWRRDFVRTYLERDVPQLGPRIPAETLRRLWTMLAHQQGGLLNAARLAGSLGVAGATVGRYLDLLVDLLLVRRLPAWHANVGKRLVRAPKVYVRDSGIVHALLGIEDQETLLGHPVAGGSWEGFAIESLLAAAGPDVEAHHYRSSGGAEVDLVITWPGGEAWAIEIKRTTSPSPGRGLRSAVGDIGPVRTSIVVPVDDRYRLDAEIEAIGLRRLCAAVRKRRASA